MELQLTNVSHAYGGTEVLRDITLAVPEGKIVCIVGPSGCGKSTLLRIMGGLERPDQGEVAQLGQVPEGCLNPLTYVFQDFALLPWRTVEGNVALALEDHRLGAGRWARSSVMFWRALISRISPMRCRSNCRGYETKGRHCARAGGESGGDVA